MDVTQLAEGLAPLVPHLLAGGATLAKAALGQLGERLGEEVWEGLQALVAKIRERAQERPGLHEALDDARAQPQDKDALAALRLQLRKLLEADPQLRDKAARVLAPVISAGNTPMASGKGSVAISGNVSGSIIVTGDGNAVRGGPTGEPEM